jgi:nitric oxide reductase subunit B
MILLSPLPIGFLQTLAAFDQGYWYARSAEFMQAPLLDILRWLRVIGDTLFGIGIFGIALFVLGLKTGWATEQGTSDLPPQGIVPPLRT